MEGVAGVRLTLTSVGPPTTNVAVLVLPPYVAEMVVAPTETGTARPVAAPTVATAGTDEVHAALVVTSTLVPSVKSAVALN
jgi:hypothetical protein